MENNKKTPVLLIIFSALSFIPVIGLVFGFISIIIGLINFKRFKILFILGVSGIAVTILIYSCLFIVQHHMEKNGKFYELEAQTTEMFLNNLSNELENYKCKYGSYPDSLEQISRLNSMIVINDMFNKKKNSFEKFGIKKADKTPDFYYKLDSGKYKLFSVGKDGKPFTNDDIYPHDKKIKPFGK
jgi:hypothetical protein